MKAYKSLVKYSLTNNCSVSVWDGEEWQVKRGTTYQAIIDAIESVDESQLRIRDAEGNVVGWAQIILEYNQPDDESVADYSCTPFMEAWDATQK